MKKFFSIFTLALLAILLVGCGEKTTTTTKETTTIQPTTSTKTTQNTSDSTTTVVTKQKLEELSLTSGFKVDDSNCIDITTDENGLDLFYVKTGTETYAYASLSLSQTIDYQNFNSLYFALSGSGSVRIELVIGNNNYVVDVLVESDSKIYEWDLSSITDLSEIKEVKLYPGFGFTSGAGDVLFSSLKFLDDTANEENKITTDYDNVTGNLNMYNGSDETFSINNKWSAGDQSSYEITDNENSISVKALVTKQSWSYIVTNFAGDISAFDSLVVKLVGPTGQKVIVKPNNDSSLEQSVIMTGGEVTVTIDLSSLSSTEMNSMSKCLIFFAAGSTITEEQTYTINDIYFVTLNPEIEDPTVTSDLNSDYEAKDTSYTITESEGSVSVTYERAANNEWACITRSTIKHVSLLKDAYVLELKITATEANRTYMLKLEGDGYTAIETYFTTTGALQTIDVFIVGTTPENIDRVVIFADAGNSEAVSGSFTINSLVILGESEVDAEAIKLYNAKKSAVKALSSYISLSSYTEEDQVSINALIASYKTAIEDSTTTAKVEELLAEYKTLIDEYSVVQVKVLDANINYTFSSSSKFSALYNEDGSVSISYTTISKSLGGNWIRSNFTTTNDDYIKCVITFVGPVGLKVMFKVDTNNPNNKFDSYLNNKTTVECTGEEQTVEIIFENIGDSGLSKSDILSLQKIVIFFAGTSDADLEGTLKILSSTFVKEEPVEANFDANIGYTGNTYFSYTYQDNGSVDVAYNVTTSTGRWFRSNFTLLEGVTYTSVIIKFTGPVGISGKVKIDTNSPNNKFDAYVNNKTSFECTGEEQTIEIVFASLGDSGLTVEEILTLAKVVFWLTDVNAGEETTTGVFTVSSITVVGTIENDPVKDAVKTAKETINTYLDRTLYTYPNRLLIDELIETYIAKVKACETVVSIEEQVLLYKEEANKIEKMTTEPTEEDVNLNYTGSSTTKFSYTYNEDGSVKVDLNAVTKGSWFKSNFETDSGSYTKMVITFVAPVGLSLTIKVDTSGKTEGFSNNAFDAYTNNKTTVECTGVSQTVEIIFANIGDDGLTAEQILSLDKVVIFISALTDDTASSSITISSIKFIKVEE